MNDWENYAKQIAESAFKAKRSIKNLSTEKKNRILRALADKLEAQADQILAENKKDLDMADQNQVPPTLKDRLELNLSRIKGIAGSVREIANLPDPIGQVVRGCTLANGLELITKKVPIGTLLVIYESRPNVTIDVAALAFKSGNACILRGGKEAVYSNTILAKIFCEILEENKITPDAISFVKETNRDAMFPFLKLPQYIDIVVPRGGEGLIRTVSENSLIPVVKHDKGVVNLFVDESADWETTEKVVLNSKTQRPSVCNALENLLIHKNYPHKEKLLASLASAKVSILPDQFDIEFTDLRLSYREVKNIEEAIEFINTYSSGHTEAILSQDFQNIELFKREIDSAGIFVNCSTRFHDGGEFGLGAEVGISTGKLHVRGPMGLEHLTTTTTYLTGNGHVRS
jgi:glutamate-5-semialdehyde dehydrogenase